MKIRIEGTDLPGRSCGPSRRVVERGRVVSVDFAGYDNIHVGVQRRARSDELLGLTPGDAVSAVWTLECDAPTTSAGVDFKGPYIQGRPLGRFIYLSWGEVAEGGEFEMFRRAKLWLDAIPPDVLHTAERSQLLVARLGLTDLKGHPLCAAVRPPLVNWSAA